MTNLMTFFNLRLAHIAPLGYAHTVNWGTAPLIPRLGSTTLAGQERSAPSAIRDHHAIQRCEMTPLQKRKHDANLRYNARKRTLRKQAFNLETES